jgi:hypothetical protein
MEYKDEKAGLDCSIFYPTTLKDDKEKEIA